MPNNLHAALNAGHIKTDATSTHATESADIRSGDMLRHEHKNNIVSAVENILS